MKTLPSFNTSLTELTLMQSVWATILNKVLRNPIVDGVIVEVALLTGDNVINHKLSRLPQGWVMVDIDAAVAVYRSAAMNAQTLTLNSSGAANAKLYVF